MITKEIHQPAAIWIDDNIRQAMKARNDAQTIFKRDRQDTTLQTHYKNLKSQVKVLMNRQRQQYYLNRFQSCRGKISLIWRTVRNLYPARREVSGTTA